MTRLLISVTNLNEAKLAARLSDLIDLKHPAQGALGALPVATIQTIRQALPNHTLSATIGDLPLVPEVVADAAWQVATTGVDYVKIGLFEGELLATLQVLFPLTGQTKLIGVILADRPVDFSVLDDLARFGFAGAMLDTADKRRGSLTELRSLAWLSEFVAHARKLRLLVGLAGSLRLEDIPPLLALKPDYLGFRGAACQDGRRTLRLDPQRLSKLYSTVHGLLPAHPHPVVSA